MYAVAKQFYAHSKKMSSSYMLYKQFFLRKMLGTWFKSGGTQFL